MRKRIACGMKMMLVLLMSASLTGCAWATYKQKPLFEMTKTFSEKYTEVDKKTKTLKFIQDFDIEVVAAGTDTVKLKRLKEKRNAIIGDLITRAKVVHAEVNARLHYTRAFGNVILDAAQIVTSSVASVIPSEQAIQALSATSLGTKGLQESVNKRYFYEHASAAVISVMNGQRHKMEKLLYPKMELPVDEYPLQLAIADWASFFLAGNIADALSIMGTEAKIKELKALETLTEIKTMVGLNQQAVAELERADAERDQAVAKARVEKLATLVNIFEKHLKKN